MYGQQNIRILTVCIYVWYPSSKKTSTNLFLTPSHHSPPPSDCIPQLKKFCSGDSVA